QEPARGDQMPKTPPRPSRLPDPQTEPSLDIGATLAQPTVLRSQFPELGRSFVSAALGTGSCFDAAARHPALATIGRATPEPPRLVISIDDFEDLATPRRKLGGVVRRLHNRPPRIRRKVARRHPTRAFSGRDEDERRPVSIPT